jgi:hypothetical protein
LHQSLKSPILKHLDLGQTGLPSHWGSAIAFVVGSIALAKKAFWLVRDAASRKKVLGLLEQLAMRRSGGKLMRSLIANFFATVFFVSAACAQENISISEPDGPIQILEYEAAYGLKAVRGLDGIWHDMKIENVSGQTIVAYEILNIAFDPFNEKMGATTGDYSTRRLLADQVRETAWCQRPDDAELFRNYGTGIAFVSKVRLVDGTVWKFDEEFVRREIQRRADYIDTDAIFADE